MLLDSIGRFGNAFCNTSTRLRSSASVILAGMQTEV